MGWPCTSLVPSHRKFTCVIKSLYLDTDLRKKKNSYIGINFPSQVLIEERIQCHEGNKTLLHLSKGHVASLEVTLAPH